MRKFDLEEAKKMSNIEIQAVICDGLAEVSHMLADKAQSKPLRQSYLEHAGTFEALGKLFRVGA